MMNRLENCLLQLVGLKGTWVFKLWVIGSGLRSMTMITNWSSVQQFSISAGLFVGTSIDIYIQDGYRHLALSDVPLKAMLKRAWSTLISFNATVLPAEGLMQTMLDQEHKNKIITIMVHTVLMWFGQQCLHP